MQVAVRVDASSTIGTGHVMRCLTLARELRQKEARVVFVSREHPGHLCGVIEAEGFEVRRLESVPDNEQQQTGSSQPAHAAWLGARQSVDLRQTVTALEDNAPWDWIIVDHYALDYRWESGLRQVADKIMVIDDLADRSHDCDLLLDQNFFQDPERRYKSLVPEHCLPLLGPKYALLRPEFRAARNFCRMRGNGAARVLIYFGGHDPDNLTGMALEALNSPELGHILVEAVIGPSNQYQGQLEKQAENRPGTRLHIQPENFTELMLRADLGMGAGGTTTWERLCLGLPSLVITAAQNQEPITRELDQAGYVCWLGNKQRVSVSDLRAGLVSEVHRARDQEKAPGSPFMVDGFGAMRAAEKVAPSSADDLRLRRVCQEDMELFFSWANDPVVRKHSFLQEPISWAGHRAWFKNKLNSPCTEMWVLQTSRGLPVGQIRFDIQGQTADIDFSLDPLVRGRDWGQKLLQMGLAEFKGLHQDTICQGRVKPENQSSMRCFQGLGFCEINQAGARVFVWP